MIYFLKNLFCNHDYEFKGRTKMENTSDSHFYYMVDIYICKKCLKRKKVKLI